MLLTKSSHHHPASQSIQKYQVSSWIITLKRSDYGLNVHFPARCQGTTTPPNSGGWARQRPDNMLQECPRQTSDIREIYFKWMEKHNCVLYKIMISYAQLFLWWRVNERMYFCAQFPQIQSSDTTTTQLRRSKAVCLTLKTYIISG